MLTQNLNLGLDLFMFYHFSGSFYFIFIKSNSLVIIYVDFSHICVFPTQPIKIFVQTCK